MIQQNEIFPVGKIEKPHGLNGEMSFSFTTDVFDTADAEFFVIDMDGIFVPFFIEEYRFKSDTTGLLKLEGVDSEEKARSLIGHQIFLPQQFLNEMDDAELGLEYFVGFTVLNEDVLIGVLISVDETTENALFVLEKDGEELLIPATDSYIVDIDHEKRILRMNLPEGLLGL